VAGFWMYEGINQLKVIVSPALRIEWVGIKIGGKRPIE
jgi:hypothetical protein